MCVCVWPNKHVWVCVCVGVGTTIPEYMNNAFTSCIPHYTPTYTLCNINSASWDTCIAKGIYNRHLCTHSANMQKNGNHYTHTHTRTHIRNVCTCVCEREREQIPWLKRVHECVGVNAHLATHKAEIYTGVHLKHYNYYWSESLINLRTSSQLFLNS